jgi:hypothetical protein
VQPYLLVLADLGSKFMDTDDLSIDFLFSGGKASTNLFSDKNYTIDPLRVLLHNILVYLFVASSPSKIPSPLTPHCRVSSPPL